MIDLTYQRLSKLMQGVWQKVTELYLREERIGNMPSEDKKQIVIYQFRPLVKL